MELNSKIEKFLNNKGYIFTILGLFIAGTALYFQIKPKKTQLELQLLSIDYLTTDKNIDNLTSNYKYNGMPVKNLWLVKYNFVNNGDRSIIGRGYNKNILDNSIDLKFNNEVQILDNIEILKNDPLLRIKKVDSITLSFSFEQWRQNENTAFTLYLKSDKKAENFLFSVTNRPIIDGDIIINDFTIKTENEKTSLFDIWFPSFGGFSFFQFLLNSALLSLSFFALLIFVENVFKWFKILKWKNKYKEQFKSFINSKKIKDKLFIHSSSVSTSQNTPKEIIKYPWRIETSLWKEFNGEKFPGNKNSIGSWKDFFLYIVSIFGLLLIIFLILLDFIKINKL